ncbi:MAG: hypothetical protein IKK58_02340 [Clostridia bacterium]|nr:hypothetical protein [Clostridia bacterium]
MKEHNKENISEQPEVGSDKGGEAMPQKFATNDQLLRAYEALEAEFTRRSQQLAALKREHGQLQELRLREQRERELEQVAQRRSEALEEFIRRYPKAADIKAELEGSIAEVGDDIEQKLKAAYMDILDRRYVSPEELLESEEFLARCMEDQRIYDGVVMRYLTEISAQGAPVLKRGGYIPLRERSKAASLEDAAEMTRELYKR